jgi:DNA polymerase-3 subunit gamma/tau
MQEHFRNLLLTCALKDTKQLEVADNFKQRYQQTSKLFSDRDLLHYLHILGDVEQSVKYSFFPELTLEMLLLKLANKPSHIQLEEILAYLEKVKNSESIKSDAIDPAKPADKPSAPTKPVKEDIARRKKNDEPVYNQNNQNSDENEMVNLKNTLKNYQNMGEPNLTMDKQPVKEVKMGLDEIQSLWSDVINKVKTTKVALASFLEDGLPHAIDRNLLTIAYDHSNTFAQQHVEKNSKLIEKIFSSDFQLPLRVKFISLDFKQLGIEQKPRTDDEILEDLKKKEPVLNDIINRFGLTKALNRDLD